MENVAQENEKAISGAIKIDEKKRFGRVVSDILRTFVSE